MKIITLIVQNEDGTVHKWQGDGFVAERSITKKGQTYQKAVDAHLVLEAGEDRP